MPSSRKISVKDLATPIRPSGHWYRGPGEGLLNLGVEIHQSVQEQLREQGCRTEVFLSDTLVQGTMEFIVSGRADVVWPGTPPIVEEIKSTFSPEALEEQVQEEEHPYRLQTLVYCYLYERAYGSVPEGQLRVVSTRSRKERLVPIAYQRDNFEAWLTQKLVQLELEHKEIQTRRKRRKLQAKRLQFPYPTLRPNQQALMDEVKSVVEAGKSILVQAPTGMGKTMGMLFPALKNALERGVPLVYVTPKNSQFAVAQAALEALAEAGTPLKVLVLSARSKSCLAEEVNCDPGACPHSRDFFDKLEGEAGVLRKKLNRLKTWELTKLQKFGKKHELCPYGLSWEVIDAADVIVCDYNYVFSPMAALPAKSRELPKALRPNLMIDEAHNLYERGMGYYSPALFLETVDEAEQQGDDFPEAFQKLYRDFLKKLKNFILEKQTPRSQEIELKVNAFIELAQQAYELMIKSLGFEGLRMEALLGLYIACQSFAELLAEEEGSFLSLYVHDRGAQGLKLKCLDASTWLKPVYKDFHSVLAFSATLKPFDFFQKLSGFSKKSKTLEFECSFPKENRKVLIIPQISTSYRDRQRNYAKIGEAVQKIAGQAKGHYIVFFPSYAFLDQTEPYLQSEQWEVIRQVQGMRASEIQSISEVLQNETDPRLVLAVQGGVLAEGVDLQGALFRGVFIVGPGMPAYEMEREKLREYYETHYGQGFTYAYTYPAMLRSIQAAGRLIRSEDKRGLIVFMDRRFLQKEFTQVFPKGWYHDSAQELVSNQILKEVQDFWREAATFPV